MHRDRDLEAFCAFFNKLDSTCTENLYNVYTEDVTFQDPLHRIEGLMELESYFAALYAQVTTCRFHFHHRQRLNDTAFVTWTMYLVHPSLARGGEVTVEGCSQLVFAGDGSGRVRRHRDYFDVGELLYERLPLLGSVVKWIKQRAGR